MRKSGLAYIVMTERNGYKNIAKNTGIYLDYDDAWSVLEVVKRNYNGENEKAWIEGHTLWG